MAKETEAIVYCLKILSWLFSNSFLIILFPILSWRAGYGSESEADDEAAHVSLPTDLGRVNRASTKSAVKLQEIGPRMSLQLIKIEEGLCSGGVIFSEYGMLIFSLSVLLVIMTSSCVDLKQLWYFKII